MKAVVGVDVSGFYGKAIDLLRRLDFEGAQYDLVHVVESVLPDKSFPTVAPDHPLAKSLNKQREEGERELAKAQSMLAADEQAVNLRIEQGDAAHTLLSRAEEVGADIIASGSERKGKFGQFFFGSVAKALLNAADQSVLLGKTPCRSAQGIRILVATDHSDYMNRCLERFIAWRPRGISEVLVMSASDVDRSAADYMLSHLPEDAAMAIDWAIERIEERNEQTAELFRSVGAKASTAFVQAHPNEAIPGVLREFQADLLVMGAQGRGFWDRVRIGSISYHQATAEEHNVLVLRA